MGTGGSKGKSWHRGKHVGEGDHEGEGEGLSGLALPVPLGTPEGSRAPAVFFLDPRPFSRAQSPVPL
jgi:hypothetical protein